MCVGGTGALFISNDVTCKMSDHNSDENNDFRSNQHITFYVASINHSFLFVSPLKYNLHHDHVVGLGRVQYISLKLDRASFPSDAGFRMGYFETS